MFRLVITIAALASSTAFAAPPATDAQSAPSDQLDASKPFAIKPTTATAAPNQVFPPIPAFAAVPPPPPSDGWDDDSPAPAETHHGGGRKGRRVPVKKVAPAPEMPVHMVVTEDSRAYLTTVSAKLDAMMQPGQHDRHTATGSESVAMFH